MRGCTANCSSQLRSYVFLCSWLMLLPFCAEALSSRWTSAGPRGRRWPTRGTGYSGKVAEPPVAVDRILTREDYFLASPSITKLKDGHLMVMYEKFGAGVTANSTRDKVYPDKLVSISSNRGKGWVPAGKVGPMLWPTVFSTESGVYAMGVERQYNTVNNMVVSRMVKVGADGDGKPSTQWTDPRRITEGLSLVTANGGLDISNGVVTKAVELVPAKGSEAEKPSAALLQQLDLDFSLSLRQMKHTGLKPRLSSVVAEVDNIGGFLEASMISITDFGGPPHQHPLFFRLSGINTEKALLVLEPELINLALHPSPVLLQPGSRVTIAGAPSAKMYGATDWQEAVLQAPAAADLTDPSVWVLSQPVGNPAGLETRGMLRLLGAGLTNSKFVHRGMLGAEVWAAARAAVESRNITENEYRLLSSDLVSPFFMEGTPVRLQDSRGGDQSLLILMRVNNDQNCNLGALISVEDGQPKPAAAKKGNRSFSAAASAGARQPQQAPPQPRFLRYTFAPGISISHAAIVYDAVSDAYWYVNNVPRDSRRNWNAPLGGGAKKGLQGSPGNSCMIDRSTLGLFYSGNAEDWIFAGMIDYNRRFLFHFTYPNMIVDGNDLLIVSRATIDDFAPDLYRNHNSNAIVMHRVRNFRRLANLAWLSYMSEEDTRMNWRRLRRRPS